MKYLFIACTVFLLTSPLFAQTIHEDDIDGFVGILSSPFYDGYRHTDYSGFVRWRIMDSDSAARRRYQDYYNGRQEMAYTFFRGNQPSRIDEKYRWWPHAKAYERYRFHLLYDGSRWGTHNILTVWEASENDSLRLVCIRHTEAMSSVHTVGFFPDSSLLVILEGRNGDAGMDFGSYTMYHSSGDVCELDSLYSTNWGRSEGRDDNTFITFRFDLPAREITEVTEFSTAIMHEYGVERYRVDSATVRVIDLWGLAQAKR